MMNLPLRTRFLCNLFRNPRAFFAQQNVFIKTSCAFCGDNRRNSKKNIVRSVVYNIKRSKVQPEVVEIRNDMKISELATTLDRTTDQIFEAMTYISGTSEYNEDSSVIDDLDIIKEIVSKCGYRFKMANLKEEKVVQKKTSIKCKLPDPAKMVHRPPVVTIMGHVDHGKTTLLDSLRNSNIVAREFGGITQHIGAFSVELQPGNSVTFLDTPGHAAFSSMRARGAQVTDIVVLVVAADDGVMKQTLESIKFAEEAGVSIIVAINKVDKPIIDIEGTKKGLLRHGIQLEEFGGDIQAVLISALKGTNLDQLLECILAQAEMMNLKADRTCHMQGVCIESRTDVGRGKLATTLIQHGTLQRGKILVAGNAWAKVRGMFNDHGQPVTIAEPGTPVEVIGWKQLPSAGDQIIEVETEQEAKQLIEEFNAKEKEKKVEKDDEIIQKKMAEHREAYNELRSKKLKLGWRVGSVYRIGKSNESGPADPTPKLPIILKGDVDGSVEAILDVIDTYSSNQCRLNVISYGVGTITENDVEMAKAFNGIIYTFNVKTGDKINVLAKEYGVPILNYNVIYKLISSLVDELNKRLSKIETDEVVGEANVLANFTVTEGKKKVSVVGCRCTKGQLSKKKIFKLVRDGEVLMQGDLSSLKHLKNEVDTVKIDVECGLSFLDQTASPQPGDQIVCFQKVWKKQTIKWNLDFL